MLRGISLFYALCLRSLPIRPCGYASFDSAPKVKGSQPRHEPHGSALNVVTLMQIDAESARLTSEHEHCIWGLAFSWRWNGQSATSSQVVTQGISYFDASDIPKNTSAKSEVHKMQITRDRFHTFFDQTIRLSQNKTEPQATIMSSPISIMTLVSDILILGAAVFIVAIVLTSLLSQYKKYLPAPIKATLGRTQSCADEDDDLVRSFRPPE
ncbi:MAG: hypothetical protein Q9175_002997 [Cornicularia normoerica]